MNYIKISKCDVANGTGARVTLWCSGCRMKCPGCHNPGTHDFSAGQPFTERTMDELIDALKPSWVKGLTLSGGHPLDPMNVDCVYEIVKRVRSELPQKDIWLYTGYTLYDCDFQYDDDYDPQKHLPIDQVVQMCDVVVDGRYIEELRDISLKFRGSSNQRLIDVKKTMAEGHIITLND